MVGASLAGTVLLGAWAQVPAADDLNTTALALVPEDAAFCSTTVNLGDQWREIAGSRLVQRMRSVPYVQQLEEWVRTEWDAGEGQIGQAKQMLRNPNVKQVLKLLGEMMGDEVFVYGAHDWCDAVEGLVGFQRRVNTSLAEGPEAFQGFLNELTPDDVAKIYVPTTVIGFRVRDEENARTQLDALEGILRIGLRDVPQAQPFLDQLKRTDFAEGQSLALSLNLSMIPPEALEEQARAALERAVALLGDRNLTIEVGLQSRVLMLAITGRPGVIARIGQASTRLVDHPVLDVLKQSAPERLRSVSYVSRELNEAAWSANMTTYFRSIADQLSASAVEEFDSEEDFEQWRDRLEADAAWLDQKVLEMRPEFGAMVGWTHAIEGGYEGFTYDFTHHRTLENAAPMHVLNHAGQSPLALLAMKSTGLPQLRQIVDFLLDKAPGHIRRFMQGTQRDSDDQRVAKAIELAAPVIKEAIGVCADKIGPALASNETMIVLDADWLISDLGPNAPPLPNPLPVPEVAIACTVTDRAAFQAGVEELFGVLDRLVDVVREVDPSAIPAGYTIPRPEMQETAEGTRYSYPQLSRSVPLPGFNPQYALGSDVVVFGYSDRQVRDLLAERELVNRPAWLTPDFPVATVCYADWAGMIQSFRSWVETGLMFTSQGELDRPLGSATDDFPTPSANDILQLWDSFTSLGQLAATTRVLDDGSTVTRTVCIGQ